MRPAVEPSAGFLSARPWAPNVRNVVESMASQKSFHRRVRTLEVLAFIGRSLQVAVPRNHVHHADRRGEVPCQRTGALQSHRRARREVRCKQDLAELWEEVVLAGDDMRAPPGGRLLLVFDPGSALCYPYWRAMFRDAQP